MVNCGFTQCHAFISQDNMTLHLKLCNFQTCMKLHLFKAEALIGGGPYMIKTGHTHLEMEII